MGTGFIEMGRDGDIPAGDRVGWDRPTKTKRRRREICVFVTFSSAKIGVNLILTPCLTHWVTDSALVWYSRSHGFDAVTVQ